MKKFINFVFGLLLLCSVHSMQGMEAIESAQNRSDQDRKQDDKKEAKKEAKIIEKKDSEESAEQAIVRQFNEACAGKGDIATIKALLNEVVEVTTFDKKGLPIRTREFVIKPLDMQSAFIYSARSEEVMTFLIQQRHIHPGHIEEKFINAGFYAQFDVINFLYKNFEISEKAFLSLRTQMRKGHAELSTDNPNFKELQVGYENIALLILQHLKNPKTRLRVSLAASGIT